MLQAEERSNRLGTRTPRVSVGLPVFNGERFLPDALDSLLAQSYDDWEVIISDNGSTDGTEAICRSYAARDARIHYERHSMNRGGAWNFNRVFDLARGEYFKWHAHDDTCAPTLLQRCVEILDREPEVVLCFPGTTYIDETGVPIGTYHEQLDLRSPSPYERYRRYHDHVCPLCSIFYGMTRRAVLARTPRMAPYVNSEVTLMSELALRGQFRELPEFLFGHRDHPLISTRALPTLAERIAWYDPAQRARGQGGHPGGRMVWAELCSITRVPMVARDRLRCYLLLATYFMQLTAGALRHLTGDQGEISPL